MYKYSFQSNSNRIEFILKLVLTFCLILNCFVRAFWWRLRYVWKLSKSFGLVMSLWNLISDIENATNEKGEIPKILQENHSKNTKDANYAFLYFYESRIDRPKSTEQEKYSWSVKLLSTLIEGGGGSIKTLFHLKRKLNELNSSKRPRVASNLHNGRRDKL